MMLEFVFVISVNGSSSIIARDEKYDKSEWNSNDND